MRFGVVVFAFLLGGPLFAEPSNVAEVITGKVIGVTNGDTMEMLVQQERIEVRLEGIDAPEKGENGGTKSTQALSRILLGKIVDVRKTGEDRSGRTMGVVMVDEIEANAKMVKEGWARHLKTQNEEARLARLEAAARAGKRGLWAEANALAPWEYRALQKEGETTEEGDPDAAYWLNTSSGVRHRAGCRHFEKTKMGRVCGPMDGKACGICGG